MSRFFQHPWGWTSAAPLACAIHCAAAPGLLLLAPAANGGAEAEWAFLAATALFAGIALPSGLRRHRDRRPLVMAVGALGLWALSLFPIASALLPDHFLTTIAALAAAAALVWNSRLHCWVGKHPCSACAEDQEIDGATLIAGEGVEGPVSG